jgi:hypothetical protein
VRLSGEAATECRVSWLVNDRQQSRSLVVGWGFIPCFEKGWLEMHKIWTCEKVVVEFGGEEKRSRASGEGST